MALIKCPECSNDVSDTAVTCPKCGYQINPPPLPQSDQTPLSGSSTHVKRSGNTVGTIIIVILILIAIGKIPNYEPEVPSSNTQSIISGVWR